MFTRADRHYVDPPLSNQDIGLISFVPCNDAKPNKYGVYGFAKIRGTFANVDESDQRALELIQKHDSVHKIYHVKVGTPFPIVHPKSLLIMPLLLMKSMSKQMLKMNISICKNSRRRR